MSSVFPNESKYHDLSDRYAKALSEKLKLFHGDATSWFTRWQNDFYLQGGKEPSSADVADDSEAVVVHKKIVIAEKILREWNISFT